MKRRESPLKSIQTKEYARDYYGYRPEPAPRHKMSAYPHQQVQQGKQELLESIRFKELQKGWRAENEAKGRFDWEGFGNKDLPIEQRKSEIMSTMQKHKIMLLEGETGCGKSTQLAQYALEMGYDRVVYLQPRRETVNNISERIDEELTEQFAQKGLEKSEHLVSMAHSDRATLHDDSVVQVMTSAVWAKRGPELQEAWSDEKVLVVADEIHEGNIETEFAVGMTAEMMSEQPNWNMVLMSATMNKEPIQRAYAAINDGPVPSVEVKGRPHEIEYNEVPQKNVVDVYTDECYVDSNKTIIFTEGQRAMAAIEKKIRFAHPDVQILKLHSGINDEERHAIFHAKPNGKKTVIISTSAGQSGLTIKGLDRVISDGFTKSPELDDESAAGLPSRACSQAEIMQQMGRGGRDIEGAKFFLARQVPFRRGESESEPEDFIKFDKRVKHAEADIYHTVLTRNVLKAAAMKRDFYSMNSYLINKVSHPTIEEAYSVLQMLGAVDANNMCTKAGAEMDQYPLRPELARAVVAAMQTGTKEQKVRMAAIAASVEAGRLSSGDPEKIDSNHDKLPSWAEDDYLAELAYFSELVRLDELDEDEVAEEKYAFDYVHRKRALKQFKKICRRAHIKEYASILSEQPPLEDEVNELKQFIVKGMPHLLYEKVGSNIYRGRKTKLPNGEKKQKKSTPIFRNVFMAPSKEDEPNYDYDRTMSNRSRLGKMAIEKSNLIVGFPRWYIDDNDNRHNVIEMGLQMNQAETIVAIGSVAVAAQERTEVGPDGRLRTMRNRQVGRLLVGTESERAWANTDARVRKLYEAALESPGPAQRELHKNRKLLEKMIARVDPDKRKYYVEKPIPTEEECHNLIKEAATGSASIGQLDSRIRELFYTKGLDFYSIMNEEQYQSIEEEMPSTLKIGEAVYDLGYGDKQSLTGSRLDNGTVAPYINNLSREEARNLPDVVQIPNDNKDVLFHYYYKNGSSAYLTAAECKRQAQAELSDETK